VGVISVVEQQASENDEFVMGKRHDEDVRDIVVCVNVDHDKITYVN
jgi:hypothetical protein